MPQKTENILLAGYDEKTIIAYSYGALESLGWTIKYAAGKTIVAYTPRSWNKYDHEITVEVNGEALTVTSKHIHGEIADLPGRNKKFVAAFLAAIDSVKNTTTDEQLNTWTEKIAALQAKTISIAEEEIKQIEEVDKAMNLSKSNLYVTYAIMAINVAVFVLMAVSGVALLQPTGLDIIKWGGNYSPLTLSGDWWRLISSVFVHIGIIHLLFNMYALYMISIYLEPMLGKARFIAAYFATGICASLASLWWHDVPVASAGASGAIFGMYGVFLALLSTRLVPKQVRDTQLKNILIFIAYNLIYGMRSGVDNAAHVGGLVGGLIIGYVYYFGWKEKHSGNRKLTTAVLVMLAAVTAGYFYIENSKADKQQRKQVNAELNTLKYKDGKNLLKEMNDFVEMEAKALEPFNNESLADEEKLKKLEEVSLPEWEKARKMLDKAKRYDVSDHDKKQVELLAEYVQLRIEQIELLRKFYSEQSGYYEGRVNDNTAKLENIIERLKALQ